MAVPGIGNAYFELSSIPTTGSGNDYFLAEVFAANIYAGLNGNTPAGTSPSGGAKLGYNTNGYFWGGTPQRVVWQEADPVAGRYFFHAFKTGQYGSQGNSVRQCWFDVMLGSSVIWESNKTYPTGYVNTWYYLPGGTNVFYFYDYAP